MNNPEIRGNFKRSTWSMCVITNACYMSSGSNESLSQTYLAHVWKITGHGNVTDCQHIRTQQVYNNSKYMTSMSSKARHACQEKAEGGMPLHGGVYNLA